MSSLSLCLQCCLCKHGSHFDQPYKKHLISAVSVDTRGVAARVADVGSNGGGDDVAFFRQFDVVICVSQSSHVIRRVDAVCRAHTPLPSAGTTTPKPAGAVENKILFFAAALYGFYGYCFQDLSDYHFYAMKTTWEAGKKVEGGKEHKQRTYKDVGASLLDVDAVSVSKAFGKRLQSSASVLLALRAVATYQTQHGGALPPPPPLSPPLEVIAVESGNDGANEGDTGCTNGGTNSDGGGDDNVGDDGGDVGDVGDGDGDSDGSDGDGSASAKRRKLNDTRTIPSLACDNGDDVAMAAAATACAPAVAELRALCDATVAGAAANAAQEATTTTAATTAVPVPDSLLAELARTCRVELSPLCAIFGWVSLFFFPRSRIINAIGLQTRCFYLSTTQNEHETKQHSLGTLLIPITVAW